jgi:hypothetical protein
LPGHSHLDSLIRSSLYAAFGVSTTYQTVSAEETPGGIGGEPGN